MDVFGVDRGRQMGVQCKQKDGLLRTRVTARELEEEVKKALGFRPLLDTFIVATSGPRDARVQERAREISRQLAARGFFRVEVWSWDEIWHALYERQELLERLARSTGRGRRCSASASSPRAV